ncbi:MAG: type II toxin-antitoxin system RelE/ParE family toxin [Alcaligenaceae bacterium]|jgi:hypothetical protein
MNDQLKPLHWIGSSLKDLKALSDSLGDVFGYALHLAQEGKKHPQTKPLRGFGGAGVLEVVADQRGDTFRAVYTVKFDAAVYVLHVFQKKSKRGAETPMPDISLINARLKTAEEHHKESNS